MRSICRKRDDTRFFECAFGVDETFVGKSRFLTMCILRRRDAILQSEFPIVLREINILASARWRIRFPKYAFGADETSYFQKASIWCRRDDTRFSKCAFGIDETLVRKCDLSKRYVLRMRDATYVILSGGELGQDWGFSLPGIVLACGSFEIGSEGL